MIRAALGHRDTLGHRMNMTSSRSKKRNVKDKNRADHRERIDSRIVRIHRKGCQHESDEHAAGIAQEDRAG